MHFIVSIIFLISLTKKLNPPFNTFPSTFILTKIFNFFALYTLYANNRIAYFHMKANYRKCHVILSSYIQKEIRLVNTSIVSSLSKRLLGITFDSELKFEEHISKICNIVNKKLNALHHIYIIISA